MTKKDQIRQEVLNRLNESGRRYLIENKDGRPYAEIRASNIAVSEEFARIEIRMRALAAAARTTRGPTPADESSLEARARETLRAIAEGQDLP